jgi:subtilisin family serine protease
VSHRSIRSTLVPVTSGLAAAIAVSWLVGVAGLVPALAAADYGVAGTGIQGQEWWLPGLHVTQAWQTTEGAGITVAVLGTGVAAGHPDLADSVSTGPDYTGSGRTASGPFWGIDGTEVAGVIAGHGHGTGGESGLLGIAPAATILSIRVDLEYNDPLNSDSAIASRLPAAIAEGITYAVDHGARVIDLPLDPGTAGLTGQGDPTAAGGSQAERAAVAYALRKNAVLVAPAGDDAQGLGLVNYPAAYPGVIAVGAVARNGQLAPFSSRHSYVSLTAPGVDLMAATPPDDYARISSTSTSSGIVAGVAALVLSRYPHLTVAQVTQALTGGTTTGPVGTPGTGHGIVDAARAIREAAAITAAGQPRPAATPSARPHQPERLPATTAADRASASALAGSLVRYVVASLGGLIVLLVALILLMRRRRQRARAAAAGSTRVRPRGLHEQRRPESQPTRSEPGQVAAGNGRVAAGNGQVAAEPGRVSAGLTELGAAARPNLAPAEPATAGGWPAAGTWQGGSLGEMAHSSSPPYRPVMTPAPKPVKAPKTAASPSGPPWAPAPEPERTIGPLPVVANSAMPPDPGPSIRVPGDMAALPAVAPDSRPPTPFEFTSTRDPDFPPRPDVSDDLDPGFPGRPDLTARQNLGFAAAPVPVDHAPPQAPDFTVPSRAAGLVLSAEADPNAPARPARPTGPRATSTDPSYIWDLAATDVFPAAIEPGPTPVDPGPTPKAPGAVPGDGDPGASAS